MSFGAVELVWSDLGFRGKREGGTVLCGLLLAIDTLGGPLTQ